MVSPGQNIFTVIGLRTSSAARVFMASTYANEGSGLLSAAGLQQALHQIIDVEEAVVGPGERSCR
jgi:hypothetical protein